MVKGALFCGYMIADLYLLLHPMSKIVDYLVLECTSKKDLCIQVREHIHDWLQPRYGVYSEVSTITSLMYYQQAMVKYEDLFDNAK